MTILLAKVAVKVKAMIETILMLVRGRMNVMIVCLKTFPNEEKDSSYTFIRSDATS